jgi:hypothetical protein
MYSAGVLPFSIDPEGHIVFLLGRDVRDPSGWADFGGKCERGDKGLPTETAAREFYEETLGVVMGLEAMRAKLKPGMCAALRGVTQALYSYWMYLVPIPYDPDVRGAFGKVLEFAKYMHVEKQLVEKLEISWIKGEDLFRVQTRHVFRVTLERNRDILEKVIETKGFACVPDMPEAFEDINGRQRSWGAWTPSHLRALQITDDD